VIFLALYHFTPSFKLILVITLHHPLVRRHELLNHKIIAFLTRGRQLIAYYHVSYSVFILERRKQHAPDDRLVSSFYSTGGLDFVNPYFVTFSLPPIFTLSKTSTISAMASTLCYLSQAGHFFSRMPSNISTSKPWKLMRLISSSPRCRMMDMSIFTDEQLTVKEAVGKICAGFPNEYWRDHDQTETYPKELHAALAKDGWLGIALPEHLGGAGLGKHYLNKIWTRRITPGLQEYLRLP
jgi:Acyl-CoA dehydrogenase, N-terminal domain